MDIGSCTISRGKEKQHEQEDVEKDTDMSESDPENPQASHRAVLHNRTYKWRLMSFCLALFTLLQLQGVFHSVGRSRVSQTD